MTSNSLVKPETFSEMVDSSAGPSDQHRASGESGLGQLTAVEKEPSILQLPYDFPKTPTTPYQPSYYPFSLSNGCLESLTAETLAARLETQSLLLAALTALFYRYTQQETIALGLTLAHVNGSTDRTEICSSIYSELKARALASHISAGLEQTIAAPQVATSANHQVLVTFLAEASSAAAAKQWMTEVQQRQANNSLDLHCVLFQDQEIAGVVEYNANLFKSETIARFVGHFQTLVAGILSEPDQSIAQLPLLTDAEEHQLLVEWNSASVSYPQIPVYQHIETHAAQRPESIALRCQDQQLSYADLNQRANQLAHYLTSLGVVAGDRVAVCVQPCLEIGVALLGIFKAGGVYVPLDPSHPHERLTAILEDTQAKVLLTQAALLQNLPTVQHMLCLDTDWATVQPFPSHNPENSLDLDQSAYIIYTSGTTGKPKGVVASHRNLVNYILATGDRFGFNSEDVMPSVARYTFSIAMFELLSPLVAGGTLVLLSREQVLDFDRMAKTLEQLTMLHTVPSLMQKLVSYIQDRKIDLQKYQGIKHIFTGGDIVAPDLLETLKAVFQNANVYVLYGCSEVSSLCCSYPVPREQTVTQSRVGRAFNNVQTRLYDPDQNLVPIGVPGEIYVSGAGVTQGYLNREDLTQEKFVTIDGQRFYRTGDLGRLRDGGQIEFLGRADFQVKLRGIRIELGEIESTLRQAPGVREGVVMACELGGEKNLVAYVVLDQTQKPQVEEIRSFLQVRLPDYMVPAAFVVLDIMPLNPNQKVDRRALPQPTVENLVGFGNHVASRNEVEQTLVEIWQRILGIAPIGIQNNFFDLGGTSLSAVQMLSEIEKQYGKNLPITTLLQANTIETLAEVLQRSGSEAIVEDVITLQKGGNKPPLFCIYGILLYRELVDNLDPEQPVYGVYLQEEVDLIKTGQLDQLNSIFKDTPTVAARYLEAIRKHQPQGPYYLAGESFGGVVAYEMAQQLRSIGEEVALVALFDSMAPNCRIEIPRLERLKLHMQLFAKEGFAYMARKMEPQIKQIRRNLEISLHQVYRKLNPNAAALPETIEEAIQEDIRQSVRAQASEAYFPQPYSGKVLLFRAMEKEVFDDYDRDLGWNKVAQDLEIIDVPGDHIGILKEPNVQVMASKLQTYLK
jgi:amino acid adenylation domain-containing protein